MSIVERALAKHQHRQGDASASAAENARPPKKPEPSVPPRRSIVLDEHRLVVAGLLPPAEMARQIGEEFRIIKRPLLRNALSSALPEGNLIMIGSAFAGAGKTFTALNMALSMAMEMDYSVLLVDADVNRQTLSRELGLSGEAGLVDVLLDENLDLADLILSTNRERLTFLPAGQKSALSSELLASQRMRELVARLGGRDRKSIVVFDAPPMLETTEAGALASHMGQIVLVVASGETPQQAVLQVIEHLDRSKAINLVLNKNERSAVSSYYGDDYGWQYGDKPTDRTST
jgi:receptor protein-tyrosine kinase